MNEPTAAQGRDDSATPLPERYWPRNGSDVTWCPSVLRAWLEMHRRAGAGNPDPTINAGVALFLLDHWEATRDAE